MQAYNHASCVIQSLGEEDINVKFLVQLDKLIRLLETPVFAYLRLQVKIHVVTICSRNLSHALYCSLSHVIDTDY